LRRGFEEITNGHPTRATSRFAKDAVLQLCGDHPLGGVQRGRPAIDGWFKRARLFFPQFKLTPLQIVVNGTPWNTTVAMRFWVDATLADGTPYHNEGVQFIRIEWGRIVDYRMYEDTHVLRTTLTKFHECVPA
jgi:ketosteroid isomerase-like protein